MPLKREVTMEELDGEYTILLATNNRKRLQAVLDIKEGWSIKFIASTHLRGQDRTEVVTQSLAEALREFNRLEPGP